MSEEDYAFMKSGFDMTTNTVVPDDEILKNITAILVTYMEGAMRTAACYLSHGSRKVITREDIKRGMMVEAFLIDKRPDLLEKTKKVKRELFAEEEDEDEDIEDSVVEDCDEDVFVPNVCTCVLCNSINTIYERWESWEPSTKMEVLLKRHISNM